MLKKIKNKLVLLISCLLVGASAIASGSFLYVKSVEKEIDTAPQLVYVAQNTSSKIEYYTVHEALSEATSGQTVIIYPNTNPTLYKNSTIKSGVTLSLPLTKSEYADGVTGNSNSATSTTKVNSFSIVNKLYINPNVTLTVIGTLNVFGILSGGNGGADWASHTADKTSAIYMDNNSIIDVKGGNILCRGYIYEKTQNNNSRINFVDGDVTIPTVMRDFKGGSVMRGYSEDTDTKHTMPFDQLMFPNIEPFMSFDYNSNLYGTINLYSGRQHNNAVQLMIGKDSTAFIQLNNADTSFEIKYDRSNEKSNLEIFGDAIMRSLSIKITAIIVTINVKSSDYFYTLSFRLGITLSPFKNGNPSNFSIPYRLCMLPGSYLKINRNATLEIGEQFTILDYQENSTLQVGETKYFFNDTEYLGEQVASKYCKADYPNSKSEANFINNGVVIANGPLSGRIENQAPGAVLEINNANNSVTTYHLQSYEKATLNISNKVYETVVNKLRGQVNSSEYVELSSGKYVSNENNYWISNDGTSTISFAQSELEIGEGQTSQLDITSSGTYTIESTNEEVASVSATGLITALRPGQTTIVAQCGTSFAYCVVNVYSIETVEFVGVTDNAISITEGNTTTVTVQSSNVSTFEISDDIDEKDISFSITEHITNEDGDHIYTLSIIAPDLCVGTATLTARCSTASAILSINVLASNSISITLDTDVVTTASVKVDSSITLVANVSGPTRTPSWTPTTSDYAEITPNGLQCTIAGTAEGSFDVKCTYGSASASVKVTVATSGGGGCILADTMIMLSDGSEKKVQNLNIGDELMSFDHHNGEFVSSPLLLNAHAEEEMRFVDVLTLNFSNNKSIKVAYNHGFYNLSRNGYVTIDNENVEQFIGDSFYFYGQQTAILTDYLIRTEYVKIYAPFANKTFNCVTNKLISVPGVVSNFLLNVYEYDQNMMIDKKQLENDINNYGLFTYEDLKNYASYEMFETLNLSYLKIGLGKGYYSMEDVIKYLNIYSKYFK